VKRLSRVVALFVALVAPGSTSAVKASNWANAGRVVGEDSGEPLVGVSVALGGSIRVTDADGRFEVPAGKAPYDVVLMSADRTLISVYLGIVRRDPVLEHFEAQEPRPGAHRAEIRGRLLTGLGQGVMRNQVQVGFFSERGHVEKTKAADAESRPPAIYGPLRVSWDGPDVLSGQLVALQITDSPLQSLLAQSAVTLHDGDHLELDVPMTPAPIEQRLAARVSPPPAPLDYPLVQLRRGHRVQPRQSGEHRTQQRVVCADGHQQQAAEPPRIRGRHWHSLREGLRGRACIHGGSGELPKRAPRLRR
jgi:hypothetical protein